MTIDEPAENNFRVAIIPEGSGVNAVCLERFVSVHGANEAEALAALETTLWWQAYLDTGNGIEPFSALGAARAEYESNAINIIEGFSVDYSRDYQV